MEGNKSQSCKQIKGNRNQQRGRKDPGLVIDPANMGHQPIVFICNGSNDWGVASNSTEASISGRCNNEAAVSFQPNETIRHFYPKLSSPFNAFILIHSPFSTSS